MAAAVEQHHNQAAGGGTGGADAALPATDGGAAHHADDTGLCPRRADGDVDRCAHPMLPPPRRGRVCGGGSPSLGPRERCFQLASQWLRHRPLTCGLAVKAAQTDDATGGECQRDIVEFHGEVAEDAGTHDRLLHAEPWSSGGRGAGLMPPGAAGRVPGAGLGGLDLAPAGGTGTERVSGVAAAAHHRPDPPGTYVHPLLVACAGGAVLTAAAGSESGRRWAWVWPGQKAVGGGAQWDTAAGSCGHVQPCRRRPCDQLLARRSEVHSTRRTKEAG